MKRTRTFHAHATVLALIAAGFCTVTAAQPAGPQGGGVVASEPGKAAALRAVEVAASVVGIDKATRTLTLKGPKGKVFDIVASEDVKNFSQIKVGDAVVARYAEALTLELRKTHAEPGGVKVTEDAARAMPGEPPAVAGARQLSAIAEVVDVDPKASTISLKGPKGNVVMLKVGNPEQFTVVKKGDQVDVTYIEAVALSVEPAPKAAEAAKK